MWLYRLLFESKAHTSVPIVDSSADAEAHGREQVNHRKIIEIGIYLDARNLFYLAETIHLINKYTCETLTLIFRQRSKAVYYIIIACGKPVAIDKIVLWLTIECYCTLDSHLAIYGKYVCVTIVDVVFYILLRMIVISPVMTS